MRSRLILMIAMVVCWVAPGRAQVYVVDGITTTFNYGGITWKENLNQGGYWGVEFANWGVTPHSPPAYVYNANWQSGPIALKLNYPGEVLKGAWFNSTLVWAQPAWVQFFDSEGAPLSSQLALTTTPQYLALYGGGLPAGQWAYVVHGDPTNSVFQMDDITIAQGTPEPGTCVLLLAAGALVRRKVAKRKAAARSRS